MPATTVQQASPQIRVEIRSNPLYLSGVRDMISAIAKRLGFTDEACGQVALAVDEALCNVIRHGYNKAPDKPIWLSVWPEGGAWSNDSAPSPLVGSAGEQAEALRIVIEDEAKQVDPAQIKSRDLDQVRPGGLGVHIIKSVMDEATYEKRGKTGMRLTMVKKRVGVADPLAVGCCSRNACGGAIDGELR